MYNPYWPFLTPDCPLPLDDVTVLRLIKAAFDCRLSARTLLKVLLTPFRNSAILMGLGAMFCRLWTTDRPSRFATDVHHLRCIGGHGSFFYGLLTGDSLHNPFLGEKKQSGCRSWTAGCFSMRNTKDQYCRFLPISFRIFSILPRNTLLSCMAIRV